MLKANEMKKIAELVVEEKYYNRRQLSFDNIEKFITQEAESGKTYLYCSIEDIANEKKLSPKEKHMLAIVLKCELRRNGYKCEYIDKRYSSNFIMSCGINPYWEFYGLFISWNNDRIFKEGYRKSRKIYYY